MTYKIIENEDLKGFDVVKIKKEEEIDNNVIATFYNEDRATEYVGLLNFLKSN